MKISKNKVLIALISLIVLYLLLIFINKNKEEKEKKYNNDIVLAYNSIESDTNLLSSKSKEVIDLVVYNNTEGKIVYDGLTKRELIDKVNRSLNSTLAGKGEIFVNHCLELGMDPYLALAIVLQETGCSWSCSRLVNYCYNIGGQKGSPSCEGGEYKAYSSLDEGIIGFLDNLYYNYYAYGLTTAEAMNPKYAESHDWAYRVNNYIEKIRAA